MHLNLWPCNRPVSIMPPHSPVRISTDRFMMMKRHLNMSDWAMWRAKLNEMLIASQVRDLSLIHVDPGLAQNLFTLAGVKEHISSLLSPEIFMMYGIPRVKNRFDDSLLLPRPYKKYHSEQSLNAWPPTTQNWFPLVSQPPLPPPLVQPSFLDEKKEQIENDNELEQMSVLTATTNTFDSIEEKSMTIMTKKPTEQDNENQRKLQQTVGAAAAAAAEINSSRIITGVNVREKVKAFETNSSLSGNEFSVSQSQISKGAVKFNKNLAGSNARTSAGLAANKTKTDSTVDSRLKSQENLTSLKNIKKKFTKTTNNDTDKCLSSSSSSISFNENLKSEIEPLFEEDSLMISKSKSRSYSESSSTSRGETHHMGVTYSIENEACRKSSSNLKANSGLARAILSSSLTNSSQFISPPLPGLLAQEDQLDRSDHADLKRDINVNSLIMSSFNESDYERDRSVFGRINLNPNLNSTSYTHLEQSVHFSQSDLSFGLKNSKLADVLKAVDGDITFGNCSNNAKASRGNMSFENLNKTTTTRLFSMPQANWFRNGSGKKKEKSFKNEKYNYLAPLKKMLKSKTKWTTSSGGEGLKHKSNLISSSENGNNSKSGKLATTEEKNEPKKSKSKRREGSVSEKKHKRHHKHKSDRDETKKDGEHKKRHHHHHHRHRRHRKESSSNENEEKKVKVRKESGSRKHRSSHKTEEKVDEEKKVSRTSKARVFNCSKKNTAKSIKRKHHHRRSVKAGHASSKTAAVKTDAKESSENEVQPTSSFSLLDHNAEFKVNKFLNDVNFKAESNFMIDNDENVYELNEQNDLIDLVSSNSSSVSNLSSLVRKNQTNARRITATRTTKKVNHTVTSSRSSIDLSNSLIYSEDSIKLGYLPKTNQKLKNIKKGEKTVPSRPVEETTVDQQTPKSTKSSRISTETKKKLIIEAIEKSKNLRPPSIPVPPIFSKENRFVTTNSSFSSSIMTSTTVTKLNKQEIRSPIPPPPPPPPPVSSPPSIHRQTTEKHLDENSTSRQSSQTISDRVQESRNVFKKLELKKETENSLVVASRSNAVIKSQHINNLAGTVRSNVSSQCSTMNRPKTTKEILQEITRLTNA